MSGEIALLAVSTLLAVLWGPDPRRDPQLRLASILAAPGSVATAPRVPLSGRLPLPVVATVVAAGVALLAGGVLGIVLGIAAAIAVLKVVPGLEPKARRWRRTAMAAQAPDVVDLLAACLSSGAAVDRAVASVAEAVDPPAADVLHVVAAQLRLGAEPHVAWQAAAAEPALAPLATAVSRALDSGAPLADSLPAVADDLRARRRTALEVATRQVGVRLTAPLGLAFLPAFVLLGVVPVIGALVTGVLSLP